MNKEKANLIHSNAKRYAHKWIKPLIALATTGLLFSILVHLSALFNFPSPLGNFSWLLVIGVFAVLTPALLLEDSFKTNNLESFKNIIPTFPILYKLLLFLMFLSLFCFIYAILAFFILMYLDLSDILPKNTIDSRYFLGICMMFYSSTLTIFIYEYILQKNKKLKSSYTSITPVNKIKK